jgi:hypothetical protein
VCVRAHVSEFVPRLVSAARQSARLGDAPLAMDPVMRTEVHVSGMVISG